MATKETTKKETKTKTVNELEAVIYDVAGKETGKVKLPGGIFGVKFNDDLVHQVVVSSMSNARTPVAHAKDRSEVRGGGAKPWKQKGTGRARHGSNRSPIWVGGGVTHGPSKDKDYSKKINKKMRAGALKCVLSAKLKDGNIIFVDQLDLKEPKTKKADEILNNLSKVKGFETLLTKKHNSALITVLKKDLNTKKSFKNIQNVLLEETKNLNPVDVLKYKYLIIANAKDSVDLISKSKG